MPPPPVIPHELDSEPCRGNARAEVPVAAGILRLGRRTKELTARLGQCEAGAIAVIDHPDLDAVAARGLLRFRPAAVVNLRPFVTGRYPNQGPGILLEADVPLFEACPGGADLFAILRDGEVAAIAADGALFRAQEALPAARLCALHSKGLDVRIAAARANLNSTLSAFAENTLHYLAREGERTSLLDPIAVPDLTTPIAGRSVVVVARGDGCDEDLRCLRPFLRDRRPVIFAVDGATEAVLALGIQPHVVVGDMDSISDAALRCGAELVVHAYVRPRETGTDLPGPVAPGLARVRSLGLDAATFPVPGTSEDAALLLAYEAGADLIVAVGIHTTLEDFLDKGRDGMASTFLVRLKVGSRLVDARGLSRLSGGACGETAPGRTERLERCGIDGWPPRRTARVR
jgi:uncharacterized membrane-anchored protein